MTLTTLAGPHTRLLTLDDAHGSPLAEFTHYPAHDLLHVSWHGPLTAAEIIRGVRHGGQWRNELRYSRILDDKSDAGGDWGDALAWLEYDWLPQVTEAGLCAMAYVFSKEVENRFLTQQFMEAVSKSIAVAEFEDVAEATAWLIAQPVPRRPA